MRRPPFWLPLLGALWVLMQGIAYAHPHVWIDLRITPQVNHQGEVTGLQQAWRFDPFYSLILIEEVERGAAPAEQAERYADLAQEVVNHLRQSRYFSHVIWQGEEQDFAAVEEFNLMRIGSRIEFSFFLPLAEPRPWQGAEWGYQIYDPSYYIEMLHHAEQGLQPHAALAACRTRLIPPRPTAEQIEYALSLDQNQTTSEPQLGRYFAERVVIDCR
ncbi:DUF1007 family protein [Marinospirillum sp. MEB164]|uniref:DUF1007 family protein n=1 Tax=Marinospirillum alkalitolerans TaxID=3123374 RepID=A0ABW8PVT0_9GAMM